MDRRPPSDWRPGSGRRIRRQTGPARKADTRSPYGSRVTARRRAKCVRLRSSIYFGKMNDVRAGLRSQEVGRGVGIQTGWPAFACGSRSTARREGSGLLDDFPNSAKRSLKKLKKAQAAVEPAN